MTVFSTSLSTVRFAPGLEDGYLSKEASMAKAAQIDAPIPEEGHGCHPAIAEEAALPTERPAESGPACSAASDEPYNVPKMVALNKWTALIGCMDASEKDLASVSASFRKLTETSSSLTKKQQSRLWGYLDSLHKRVARVFIESDLSQESSEEVLGLTRHGFAQMTEWTHRTKRMAERRK